MFKSTAASEQRRHTISRADESKSTSGVDPSAWKDGLSERARIVAEVKDIQLKSAVLTAKIAEAGMRATGRNPGRPVSLDMVNSWKAEKAKLAVELNKRQTILSNLKIERGIMYGTGKSPVHEDRKTFERAFFNMAKHMLAEPVFDRILAATIHRMGEGPNQ